jgi:hypothetical protein
MGNPRWSKVDKGESRKKGETTLFSPLLHYSRIPRLIQEGSIGQGKEMESLVLADQRADEREDQFTAAEGAIPTARSIGFSCRFPV